MRWLIVVGAITLAACSAGADEPVSTTFATEPLGAVTLHWTLADRADPGACTDARAAVIDVWLTRSDTGEQVAMLQEPCTTFVTSVALAPGSYRVRGRLVSTNGEARTPIVELAPFVVTDESTVVLELAF